MNCHRASAWPLAALVWLPSWCWVQPARPTLTHRVWLELSPRCLSLLTFENSDIHDKSMEGICLTVPGTLFMSECPLASFCFFFCVSLFSSKPLSDLPVGFSRDKCKPLWREGNLTSGNGLLHLGPQNVPPKGTLCAPGIISVLFIVFPQMQSPCTKWK